MTREKILQDLNAAADRVAAWPEWKRIMFQRTTEAEKYFADMRVNKPRTPKVPPCPVGELSNIPDCGDVNCTGH